ncbi:hypothetical protein CLG96_17705 [Sphingomonas oleivorans]|uniref:Uncharacterized protein n=1 Tax=Sphingomonas oleivorans TaxID=1735121 RepID=A0A2T5FTJ1_9SPHN|nr:tetratricopeptide repeat protein [Sphingomonas oleivorans]PTQ07382.1 hypothetical protein CLG96_17705 [Sphingomonas oleivorans]
MKKSMNIAIAILAVTLGGGAAIGAVTVVGKSSARLCYEAAERHESDVAALAACDAALAGTEALSASDITASHVNRGIVRMRGSDLTGAIADFDAAIARDHDQAEAYLNKGLALMRQESSWHAARAEFDQAIAKGTRKPALAHFGRGIVEEHIGNVRAAYADYRRALELDPEWAEPARELARFKLMAKG